MNLALYYSPVRPVVFMIGSLVWIFIQLQQGTDQLVMKLTLPIALILYCVPRLHKVHLKFENGTLTIYAGFGPVKRTLEYQSFKDFYIEKNRLYLNINSTPIKITEAWALRRSDWETLSELISNSGNPLTK